MEPEKQLIIKREVDASAKEQCLKDDYSILDMLGVSGVKPYLRGKVS